MRNIETILEEVIDQNEIAAFQTVPPTAKSLATSALAGADVACALDDERIPVSDVYSFMVEKGDFGLDHEDNLNYRVFREAASQITQLITGGNTV